MQPKHLIVLLPCHSLEDLSLRREAADAEQILSAWSALWHPALIVAAESVPGWIRADAPPQEPVGYLVTIPHASESRLPADWLEAAARAGAALIRGLNHRHEVLAAALACLDPPAAPVDAELVADFQALSFAYLQVELLTRQLRYMSNLDEYNFQREVLAAAQDAVQGNREEATRHLQRAFDLLHDSREYFYPVEAHLLDLTLVAPTTTGPALRAELVRPTPVNLMMSAEVVEHLAQNEPETLHDIREALEQGRLSVVGGEYREAYLPLLPPEAILNLLGKGVQVYETHLGRRPVVFARRRFGLTPALPQILKRLGFSYGLHFTLDDGKFPTGNQSRFRWEGMAREVLDALGRVPVDITHADTMLALPETLGNRLDLDHVATLVMAHWPGRSSPWYEDVQRASAYGSVLGKFEALDEYFHQTELSGQTHRYRADEYRSPWLRQAVGAGQADPLSRWVRYYRLRALLESAETLETLAALLCGQAAADEPLAELALAVDEFPGSETADDETLRARLETRWQRAGETLAGAITAGGPRENGYLVVNPLGFSRDLLAETPALAGEVGVSDAVRLVDRDAGRAVAEVPGLGFAWVGAGPAQTASADPPKGRLWKLGRRKKPEPEPPLAEEGLLRNEFFEVRFDPVTGALRSVHDYQTRGNRLGQQLALRMAPSQAAAGEWTSEEGEENYTIMAADSLAVVASTAFEGAIEARGRLVERGGQVAAHFRQTTRIRRGSRVIELAIELDPRRQPGGDPWNSYYAARFAWNSATVDVLRDVNMAAQATDVERLEAPRMVDIRSHEPLRGTTTRTTILTGGLPFHRRFGLRMMDTLLVVQGERARTFRLGIGIDLPQPTLTALDFLAPTVCVPVAARPATPSAWLLHLGAKNVVATSWQPLVEEGRVVGLRARLLETEGRPAEVALRSFRPFAKASKNAGGQSPATQLAVDGERVACSLRAHEWVEINAWWS